MIQVYYTISCPIRLLVGNEKLLNNIGLSINDIYFTEWSINYK